MRILGWLLVILDTVAKWLSSKSNENDKRESIWSVTESDRRRFAYLSVFSFFPSLIAVSYYEIWHTNFSTLQKTAHIIQNIGTIGVSCVTLAFFLLEGVEVMSLLLGNARELIERKKVDRERKDLEKAVQKFVERVEEKFGTEKSVSLEDIRNTAQEITSQER